MLIVPLLVQCNATVVVGEVGGGVQLNGSIEVLDGSLKISVLVVEVGMATADVRSSIVSIQLYALVKIEDSSIIVLLVVEGIALPEAVHGLEGGAC